MNIWFCSDFHFGHFNIIKYCNRPFKSLEEMDNAIINNFNQRVKENDLVLFFGDFCFNRSSEATLAPKKSFEYYRNQLKCKNIIFIRGSHDKNNEVKTPIRNLTINIGGKEIFCVHDPKEIKKNYFFIFAGHWHGKFGKFIKYNNESTVVDLSVENWNYYPVDYTEIWKEYSKWLKR